MIQLEPHLLDALDGSVEGLRQALQTAVRLEFSTIPPYLYALYSIKPGRNREIASLIKSVVVQEMLHMALDCNILTAICGSPAINHPKLVPKYPGRLPGSVEHGVVVRLAPFSKELLSEVFMPIEEPEMVLEYPFEASAFASGKPHVTIGEFYAKIKGQIRELGDGIFLGDPARQLTTGFGELRTRCINDAEAAMGAIDLIVEQGEGTKTSPLDPEAEPAHYYRFAEIYAGRKLVRNCDPDPEAPKFKFGGHAIEFDPDGVWPVIANPSRPSYNHFPKARDLNDAFNGTYTRLLDTLHLAFNGEPDRLALALGFMESMKEQAAVMIALETVPGRTAGPTFEYRP